MHEYAHNVNIIIFNGFDYNRHVHICADMCMHVSRRTCTYLHIHCSVNGPLLTTQFHTDTLKLTQSLLIQELSSS